MISYIKSELYRILHNKWSYLFILICSALLVSSNVVLAVVQLSEDTFRYANTAFAVASFINSISLVFIICIMVGSMIFGNEHGNHTMKNSISYGISRGTIYFSKLFIEILYSIIAFIIITASDVVSAYLLLEHSHVNELNELWKLFAACLPIFLFVLGTVNCFAFILESTGAAIGAEVGLAIAFPLICGMLGQKFEFFRNLARVLPWNMINAISIPAKPYNIILPWEGNAGYYNCWVAGIVQMVIIVAIGYIILRKKEIK